MKKKTARKKPAEQKPRKRERLDAFARAFMLTGNVREAARQAGVPARQAYNAKAQADALGILEATAAEIRLKFDIDVGALIQKLQDVLAGVEPSRRQVWRNGLGVVKGTQETYDIIEAVQTLARLAGALSDRKEDPAADRLADVLREALEHAKALREEDRRLGIVPAAARAVRARLVASLPPGPQDVSPRQAPAPPPSPEIPPSRTPPEPGP